MHIKGDVKELEIKLVNFLFDIKDAAEQKMTKRENILKRPKIVKSFLKTFRLKCVKPLGSGGRYLSDLGLCNAEIYPLLS